MQYRCIDIRIMILIEFIRVYILYDTDIERVSLNIYRLKVTNRNQFHEDLAVERTTLLSRLDIQCTYCAGSRGIGRTISL